MLLKSEYIFNFETLHSLIFYYGFMCVCVCVWLLSNEGFKPSGTLPHYASVWVGRLQQDLVISPGRLTPDL